jgi:hypothetical protein
VLSREFTAMEYDTKRQYLARNRGEDAYDEIARENREVSPKHLRYTYLSIFYVAVIAWKKA